MSKLITYSTFTLFIIVFLFTETVNAQSQPSDYLNIEKTKKLIKTNLDSAYQDIQFFKELPCQYDYLMGLYYRKNKEYKKSKKLLLSSIKKNKHSDSEPFLDAYYYLAYDNRRLGELDSAIINFLKAIELEKDIKQKKITAKSYGGLGIVFRQKNEIDSAIHYINLSNIEYQKINDTTGLARVQNTLGNLYRTFDTKLSIKHYLKALNFYQKLGKEKETAIINQNLGLIFSDEEKYEIALEYLKGAYQYFLKEGYTQYQVISLNNIGYTYLNMKNYEKAEESLLKAIKINKEYDYSLAFSYTNLGTAYNLEKKYNKAEIYLKKALKISLENNIEYLLVEIYSNLTSLSVMQNKHQAFLEYFDKYNNAVEEIQNEDISNALAKYENDIETIETKNLLKLAIKNKKLREQEIEKNKAEIFTKNILLFFGVIIIILLTVIAFTIYKSNKKRKALNIAIQKKNAIIRKYNIELETKIEERTKELKIAKKKAEESDLLKSTFLANISHEIRTPLNSIMGFSDLLSEQHIDKEDIEKYGKIIRHNGFELLNIINDIIDVSKIEANMFSCKVETIKHSTIVEQIESENFEKAKYYNKSSSIDFIASFVDKEISVRADLFKLIIVFNKLINNAFQFTEEGFIHISSEVKDNKLIFSISDSGIGIPKERLPQIFENFRKFHKDEHLKYRGLGVGLYIAYHILNKMGSDLQIESTNGKGSTFSFKLDIIDE